MAPDPCHVICPESGTRKRVRISTRAAPAVARSTSLGRPQDQMDTAVRIDDVAHLADLEAEGSFLKWTLHLPAAKRAKVAA